MMNQTEMWEDFDATMTAGAKEFRGRWITANAAAVEAAAQVYGEQYTKLQNKTVIAKVVLAVLRAERERAL